MLLAQEKKIDFEFSDHRGKLVQIVHEGYQQINVLKSNKGVTRGEHFHKFTCEAFYVVSGKCNVTLMYEGKTENKSFNEGDFFEIRPFTVHSLYFPEDCILIALYNKPIEQQNGTVDIYY